MEKIRAFILKFLPVFLREKISKRIFLKKMIANTGWYFSEKALRLGLGLFVSACIARYLGPAQFGKYNYALAFALLFTSVSTLGLDLIIVRNVVRYPDRKLEILGTAFVLRLISAVGVLFVSVGLISMINPGAYLVRWLVSIFTVVYLFQVFDVIDLWFQSQNIVKYQMVVKSAAFVVMAMLRLALIFMKAPLIIFAVAYLAEFIIVAVFFVIIYRKKVKDMLKWSFRLEQAKALLADGWPLILSGPYVLLNTMLDKVMVGKIAGYDEVGVYSAASRLSCLWYFAPVLIGATLMPVLTKYWHGDRRKFKEKIQEVLNFVFILSFFMALPISLLAPLIIKVIYGAGYARAGLMLSIHMWTAIFVFHVLIRDRGLVVKGEQKYLIFYAFGTTLTNVGINLILIPRWGGIGASCAALISWIVCVVILPATFKETKISIKMFFRSVLFPVNIFKKMILARSQAK